MKAWNKGKRVGQKKAFKLADIWRVRIRLELENNLEQYNYCREIQNGKVRLNTWGLKSKAH